MNTVNLDTLTPDLKQRTIDAINAVFSAPETIVWEHHNYAFFYVDIPVGHFEHDKDETKFFLEGICEAVDTDQQGFKDTDVSIHVKDEMVYSGINFMGLGRVKQDFKLYHYAIRIIVPFPKRN
jgi:hypothetical protein